MSITRRALFYAAAVALLVFIPAIEGALRPKLFWPLYAFAAAVVLYAFAFNSARAKKAVVVIVSCVLTVTAADLLLRLTSIVPDELVERWPRLPLVRRYIPDLNFESYRFDHLSRVAGVKEWREEKLVRVVTDSEGFRNERTDTSRPLDVIILGDSFGGGAVSQEYTWSSLLARDHQLNTYNLSSPASGPWNEYVNLWVEKDRLKTREGTHLVWQLFTGNDLDDPYGSLDVNSLPWCGPLEAWLNRFNDWREHSPVRLLIENSMSGRDPREDVIARDFLNGRKMLFFRPYTESSFRTAEQVVAHTHFEQLRETIRAGKNLAQAHGLRPFVMLVPSKEEVYSWVLKGGPPWSSDEAPSGFSSVLARVCAEEGVKFLDLKPSLVEESRRAYEESGQVLYWYDDTHLSTAGNVFTASVIYREILR
jgi:lysophospholipase L1-like esterase